MGGMTAGQAGLGGAGMGGGTGGDGMGGTGEGGGTLTCMSTVQMAERHTHPLNVPASDIERGYQDAPYVLEDGGTGHTHTLTLTAYDFVYLQSGSIMPESTMDEGHVHICDISCARE
jgi:hypothetical protein